jgi:Domain of unknown function (DUF4838)
MFRKILCTVGFITLTHLPQVYAETDLTMKSKKSFVIVYPARALRVEKTAAEELAKYLALSVGAKTQIRPESKLKKAAGADAYIGKCKFTQTQDFYVKNFKREGFQIAVKNGKLFIYGDDGKGRALASNNRTGTLFGVYDFLENEIGIAWIWPGENGEDVPEYKELKIKSFSRIDYPRLENRMLKFSAAYNKYEPKPGDDFKLWFKRMKLSYTQKSWFGHSGGKFMGPRAGKKAYEIVKKHPEWTALWDGKRTGPHYCTSNKEWRDYMVEQCINNPSQKKYSIVSVSPNDGFGFCECKNCRALDPEGTDYSKDIPNLSNRHWDYANYIAKEVKKKKPELGIGMLAYTAYAQPPTNIDKFSDNLYTQVCYSVAYMIKPEKKKEFYDRILRWGAKGMHFHMYEYWGMHYWMDLPCIWTTQMKETMPFLYKNGLLAIKGESAKNFATQGPNYYLVSHMMWNPDTDADKVLDRFYKAFGPAAGDIKKYYETFERSFMENHQATENFGYINIINAWPEIFPEKTIKAAGECIKRALDAVKYDPVYEERVRIVDAGFYYTRTMVELLKIYRKLGRSGVPLWCFGKAGFEAEFKFWNSKGKLPKMPAQWVEFIKQHPKQPIARKEKIKLLKRALYLGNERERILHSYIPRIGYIASLGMYERYRVLGYYPWHQAIKAELRKEGIK